MKPDESSTLTRIRCARVMRVGTTGDYTPFGLLQPDDSYQGADIDMACGTDVMVTDGLEADHQARLHPELRAVPVAPFTRLERACKFARDPAMKHYIDARLGEAIAAGRWQQALGRAMGHAARANSQAP